jgi:thioredoxin reductase
MHDVCIVGAGPAGLNAALILGRCRRRVIVFDSGRPRNAVSRGLHVPGLFVAGNVRCGLHLAITAAAEGAEAAVAINEALLDADIS